MGLIRQNGFAVLDARSAHPQGINPKGEERSDESNQVYWRLQDAFANEANMERCQSGRMGLIRNQVYGLPYRGFESHPLRHS